MPFQLFKYTGSPDITTIPGFTLTPLDLEDLGIIESKFITEEYTRVIEATEGMDPEKAAEVQDRLMEQAALRYGLGSDGYYHSLWKVSTIYLMVWLSLKHEHKTLTFQQAKALITDENYRAVSRLMLEYAGVQFKKKAAAPAVTEASQPTSPPSSNTSVENVATASAT